MSESELKAFNLIVEISAATLPILHKAKFSTEQVSRDLHYNHVDTAGKETVFRKGALSPSIWQPPLAGWLILAHWLSPPLLKMVAEYWDACIYFSVYNGKRLCVGRPSNNLQDLVSQSWGMGPSYVCMETFAVRLPWILSEYDLQHRTVSFNEWHQAKQELEKRF